VLTIWQNARRKLENRRLAYDASLAKMQKAKKEDFRVEEELRAQKAKYEESSEDVFRRMQDIKEAEMDLVQDLTDFLEAELSYHDRCREILLNVKRDWPVRYVTMTTDQNGEWLTTWTETPADPYDLDPIQLMGMPKGTTRQRTTLFPSYRASPSLACPLELDPQTKMRPPLSRARPMAVLLPLILPLEASVIIPQHHGYLESRPNRLQS